MQYRENTYVYRAGGAMANCLILIASCAVFMAIAYSNVFVVSDDNNFALGIVCLGAAVVYLGVLLPYRLVQFVRLMAQVIREDNELGLDEPKTMRADAGRDALEDSSK